LVDARRHQWSDGSKTFLRTSTSTSSPTEKLGSLDGVERIESEPLLRSVKQLGTVR
jgi:hypothetical protein